VIISEPRQGYFARMLIDELWGDELIDFDEEQEDSIIRQTRMIITQWVAEQGDIDENVRQKISTLKRGVMEGTAEWSVMYKKYFQEEMSRRGFK
jgi:uncharacterized protein